MNLKNLPHCQQKHNFSVYFADTAIIVSKMRYSLSAKTLDIEVAGASYEDIIACLSDTHKYRIITVNLLCKKGLIVASMVFTDCVLSKHESSLDAADNGLAVHEITLSFKYSFVNKYEGKSEDNHDNGQPDDQHELDSDIKSVTKQGTHPIPIIEEIKRIRLSSDNTSGIPNVMCTIDHFLSKYLPANFIDTSMIQNLTYFCDIVCKNNPDFPKDHYLYPSVVISSVLAVVYPHIVIGEQTAIHHTVPVVKKIEEIRIPKHSSNKYTGCRLSTYIRGITNHQAILPTLVQYCDTVCRNNEIEQPDCDDVYPLEVVDAVLSVACPNVDLGPLHTSLLNNCLNSKL